MGTAEVQVFSLSGDSRRTPAQGRRRSIVRTHPVRRAGPWGLAARMERRCRARQGAQGSGCSVLTPVRTSAWSWTRPGRACNPCLSGRSPQLPGTELSAAQQGPGGRAGVALAACVAGSRTTWRTRSYPRRWAALPAGNLSTRARWPPYPRPEASPAPPGLRGAATQSGVRCQPGYPLCASLSPAQLHAAPQGVCRPPPLPTRTFPKTRFWRLSSPPGHLL